MDLESGIYLHKQRKCLTTALSRRNRIAVSVIFYASQSVARLILVVIRLNFIYHESTTMAPNQPVIVSPRITEMLEQGESETVEFKSRLPEPKLVARIIVAFANTRGGTLLVGVNDSGEPIGMPDAEAIRTQGRLREIASSFLASDASVGIVDIRGRSVVYLDVPKAPANLSPIATAEGEFYVRRGVTDQRARAEDLVRDARRTESPTHYHQVPSKGGRRKKRNRGLQLFVAMSFAFEEEPVLVDHFEAIRRAAQRTNRRIKIVRVDLEAGDYEISQKVMGLISESDIILADFTRSPQNVYFEAGYARGCGKMVLQTARSGTELHFDVQTWRTTFFKNATELEEKLVGELAAVVGKNGRLKQQRKLKRKRSG